MTEKKTEVTMIDDPFGFKTLEISEAQQTAEELILDRDLETDPNLDLEDESEETTALKFEKIAGAISQAQAEELATLIASQIAEDSKIADTLAEDAMAEEALADTITEDTFNESHDEIDEELRSALPSGPDLYEVQSCVEALLFMSDKPLSAEKLHELLGPQFSFSIFQEAITAIMERYQSPQFGVEVVAIAGGYQLRTKAGRAALAKKLAKVQTQRLSSGGMESLAIIAYKQPVMKDDIDKIRGVDSSYFIRNLMDRKLIQISGRSELPGRPLLYSTTNEFLELFGLKDLAAMPSLRELEQMVPTSQSANPDDESPVVKQMRKLVGQMNADVSTTLNYNPREDETILKEIRERVASIPVSTPYLDEQKALEKQQAELAEAGIVVPPGVEAPIQPQLSNGSQIFP